MQTGEKPKSARKLEFADEVQESLMPQGENCFCPYCDKIYKKTDSYFYRGYFFCAECVWAVARQCYKCGGKAYQFDETTTTFRCGNCK
jgi:hypothetical protein